VNTINSGYSENHPFYYKLKALSTQMWTCYLLSLRTLSSLEQTGGYRPKQQLDITWEKCTTWTIKTAYQSKKGKKLTILGHSYSMPAASILLRRFWSRFITLSINFLCSANVLSWNDNNNEYTSFLYKASN
jgi:hypothetical protein